MTTRTHNMQRLDAECRRRGWRLHLGDDLHVTERDPRYTIGFVQIQPGDRRRRPVPIEVAADMLLAQIAERDRHMRRQRGAP